MRTGSRGMGAVGALAAVVCGAAMAASLLPAAANRAQLCVAVSLVAALLLVLHQSQGLAPRQRAAPAAASALSGGVVWLAGAAGWRPNRAAEVVVVVVAVLLALRLVRGPRRRGHRVARQHP